MNNILLSQRQAADILKISENTLCALAYSGQIPHTQMQNPAGKSQLYFNSFGLVNWIKNLSSIINMDNATHVNRLKARVNKQKGNLSILRKFDNQFTHKRKTKGYSLQKVPNKKLGYVFYVRYYYKGNVLPRRSTHTNNYDLAVEFAEKMREELINDYYNKKRKKPYCRLYNIMKNFYIKDSHYHITDTRSKPISDDTMLNYQRAIKAHWIPFLKYKKITELEDITSSVIIDYQNYCSKKGLSSQSVNFNVSILNRIFDYLICNKYIEKNPTKGVPPLYVDIEKLVEIRGCYNINELQGVFNKRWQDEIHYLLIMLIYTTGMRNSEIKRIKTEDIIKIKNTWFINIKKSKSKFGIRIVPLHNFVYKKLITYIKKYNKEKDDFLFCQRRGKLTPKFWFNDANIELGLYTNRNSTQLFNENITFYSGRHFFKTLMNANNLGEAEEVFMGHKVTGDVAKRYNHRDKQGQEVFVKKAKEVFKILDEAIFKTKKRISNPASKKPVRKSSAKRPVKKQRRKPAARRIIC